MMSQAANATNTPPTDQKTSSQLRYFPRRAFVRNSQKYANTIGIEPPILRKRETT